MKKLEFTKGSKATEDDLRMIWELLPIGVRKSKDDSKWDYDSKHMKEDLMDEEFFKNNCEIIVRIKKSPNIQEASK